MSIETFFLLVLRTVFLWGVLHETSAAKEHMDFAVAFHVERSERFLARNAFLQLRGALACEHRLVHHTRA